MEIRNPRRILVLGAPKCGTLDLIKALTGSVPSVDSSESSESIAGLLHELDIRTAYYNAKIPMWIDEIADLAAWKNEFLKPEAKEVVEAVGAWIYCFRTPGDEEGSAKVEDTMDALQNVMDEHGCSEESRDVVMLSVEMPPTSEPIRQTKGTNSGATDWEGVSQSYSFEYINYSAKGSNDFGEKVGVERIMEALESNEWDAGTSVGADAFEAFSPDQEDDVLNDCYDEEAKEASDLYAMSESLLGDRDLEPETDNIETLAKQAREVDDLDRMMNKLLAVKEQTADLPETQRKAMAARAVGELMKGSSGSV